jgi:hypothetical protein
MGGVFHSTDNGSNWSPINTGLANAAIGAFAVSGSNLFAGAPYEHGVFLSKNSGTLWTAVDSGLWNQNINALAISGTNVFAGTYGSGIFFSTNNGTSWTAASTGLTDYYVVALAVSGTNLFVSTYGGGVFLSTNDGKKWATVNSGMSQNVHVNCFAFGGSNIFAGTSNGVFCSPINAVTWKAVRAGLTDTTVTSLAVIGTYLFACTGAGGGIFRRPLSEMITSAERPLLPVSMECALVQNYPNPFNPTTTIGYVLPYRSVVSLTVYNMLGQKVSQLVNGEINAGYHEVKFDGSKVASGMYFYRIQAGGYVRTKTLLLLR